MKTAVTTIATPTTTHPLHRQLRPYQTAAVDATLEQWRKGIRRTSVVLPTGTGKSTVIAKTAAIAHHLGLRVVVIAHRDMLLDQLIAAIRAVDPSIPVGRLQADQTIHPSRPVVAASIQTLAHFKRRRQLGPRSVFLFDETHHVTSESWLATLDSMGVYDDTSYFCGYTATMRRTEGKALRTIIESIAYERDLRWAFAEGHLVKPKGLTVRLPHLDLNKVRTTAGDFNDDALAEVMEAATEDVVNAILTHAAERRPIIFAASVLAAQMLADMLTARGYPTECVVGTTKRADRQGIFARFESGATRAVTTVAVLTEGADYPWCDCVVIARPTKSPNLYVQMTGRCERLYEGKTDALVLDLVGTTRVLKLVTLSSLDAGTESRTVDENGDDEADDHPDPRPEAVPQPKQIRNVNEFIAIDLLGDDATDVRWLQTPYGVPFFRIPASARQKDIAVFLWPLLDGTFQPGWVYMNSPSGGWLDSRSWPLKLARDLACDFVEDHGANLPSRSESWYRKHHSPSTAQLEFAARLGIVAGPDTTKGRISDLIDIAQVSRRLRPNEG